VAQLASVLAWGASGRPFESDHPDQLMKKRLAEMQASFVLGNFRKQPDASKITI